jgi:hypothetical protein
VSTAVPEPAPYRVSYSERVRQRLLALADIARQRGDGEAFVAALKEFHRRLCVRLVMVASLPVLLPMLHASPGE